jgi:hypothetical protein
LTFRFFTELGGKGSLFNLETNEIRKNPAVDPLPIRFQRCKSQEKTESEHHLSIASYRASASVPSSSDDSRPAALARD